MNGNNGKLNVSSFAQWSGAKPRFPPLLQELIQNADDAGATEVRFLYDERTNKDSLSCLIDDGE